MLTSIFTKAVRDRWLGATIAGVGVGLLFAFSMLVYRDIDLSIYDTLPDFVLAVVNVPQSGNAGILAFSAVYGTVGALALAGFAISMGSASIAGEERNGTLGLLLGNPRSRTHVLVSKLLALVLLIGLTTLLLWAAAAISPPLMGVDVSELHIGAFMLHMYINALFYGLLATVIGAATGSGTVASGATAAIMGISFIAAGVLPLVEGAGDIARIFPWYYYDSSQPLNNGAAWGDLAVLIVVSLVFAVGSVLGFNRRDLKNRSAGSGLLGRLRDNPLARRFLARFSATTRVSHIWVKTFSDHRGLILIASVLIFAVAVMEGAVYPLIDDMVIMLAEQLPDALMALTGGGDLSTPQGFYQLEVFGLVGPIAVIAVAVAIGSGALAGEEHRGTMGLLLANPIRRSYVIWQKGIAMILATGVVGVGTYAGTFAGSVAGGLDLDLGNIAAAAFLMTLLGLVFGALAFAIGGLTGQPRKAVFGAAGAALLFYVLNSFLPMSESLADFARASPFYYFLASDPLVAGLNLGHAAVLAVLSLLLMGGAVLAFDRRDIRK